ncbi:hypothetical protein HYV49_06295, partial [Candidatus Pacearchaeota archaeon]|nr:hypothetical protein [Candidatus Pacearchaeota archaeon]
NSQCTGITASACGNNVQETGEQCDGSDNALCSSGCLLNCTCLIPPPATIQIISLLNNDVIMIGAGENTTNVTVTFNAINFVIGGKGGNHIHFSLSNVSGYTFNDEFMFYNTPSNIVELNLITGITQYAARIDNNTIRFNNVPLGIHNLRARLVDSSHLALTNAEATETIVFRINSSTAIVGYCGDAICDSSIGESCSSCSTDCGQCPTQDSGTSGGGGGGAPKIIAKPVNETILIPQIEKIDIVEGATSSIEIDKEESIIIDVYGSSYELSFVITDEGVVVKSFSGDYLIPRDEALPIIVGNREIFMGIERFEEDKASIVMGLEQNSVNEKIAKGVEEEKVEELKSTLFNIIVAGIVVLLVVLVIVIVAMWRKRR